MTGAVTGRRRSLTRRLALTVGTGVCLNQADLTYAGRVHNNATSLGWMLAGSYAHPLGQRFRLGVEIRWLDAMSAGDAVFTTELQLAWRALSW